MRANIPEPRIRRIGSGVIVALGMAGMAIALLTLGHVVGWNATWRAFGVTPLQPPFFDMHVINDYAACAAKGIDAYAPRACNADNFNIPPVWLWLGSMGIGGADSNWLSIAIIAGTAIVMVLIFRGRSWGAGLIALGALISPSVMMGVERGNLDLLILALVGTASLVYHERSAMRLSGAGALLCLGIALKLFPIFCVSVVARFTKKSLIAACIVAMIGLIYVALTIEYVALIRRNVPTTFILSYGYKAAFLGLDHIRSEAGLSALGIANTWLPASMLVAVLICTTAVATNNFRQGRDLCLVDASPAGTAFLFGAGIYCGTYLLGTNFVYRLMFLLLCLPQLLDWEVQRNQLRSNRGVAEVGLLVTVLGALWLNGNADGHSISLLLPQLLNWFLFLYLSAALVSNLLHTAHKATTSGSQSSTGQ